MKNTTFKLSPLAKALAITTAVALSSPAFAQEEKGNKIGIDEIVFAKVLKESETKSWTREVGSSTHVASARDAGATCCCKGPIRLWPQK